jgi:RNA polymerase sigma-70 factor (ECF subfamily)
LSEASQAIFDELLAIKCRRGDALAWRQLVDRYDRRLLYFIRRLIGSERDAYDVLQQTWLAAWGAIAKLKDPRLLRTWLYRIARNQAISHLRKQRGNITLADPADLCAIAEADPGNDGLMEIAPSALHGGLERLSLAHREALTLHFLEGASIEEIAEVIDVPPGTVKSRLFHARRALRQILESEGHV